MPIYEFYCPDNNRIYSFLSRSLAHAGKTPRCPDNPSYRMERMVSAFSVTGRAKEPEAAASAAGEAEDPRLMAAMAEMEREMAGMDENNPDPRQLARMMRKMTDLAGEKIPAPMQELIARMEAGEDLESLEEKFGDLDDTLDDAFDVGEEGAEGEPPVGAAAAKALRAFRKRPRRDPTLYDIRDYLDPA